ncbi:MAG: VWA domain-containing protein [Desulfobacterales bacterium]|nr:VWA domain-containing protein [Desulfobacterales bacterium]
MTRTNEQDPRVKLFNTLLTTPHRNLDRIYPVHQEIISQDPLFYVHLAAWYSDEGTIRDHREMFVINLILSDFPGHRDTGLAMLREFPPYQVGRVFDYIKGKIVKLRIKDGKKTEVLTEKHGLFRNVPRTMKTEIIRYLREREEKPEWFDASVLQARHAIKRLYASLRIPPSSRAQAILFDENPPRDSRVYALKLISKTRTPAEQARAIVDNKIPYRVASSVIKQMTPTVLVALIQNMSPQELINNVGSLKRRGAFDNPDVKKLIEDKLEKAQTSERVSAYKAKVASKAAGVSDDVAKKLDAVTESQVKAAGVIKRPTALLIDKSSSLEIAIEVGKQLGAMVSSICEADLFTYAFDSVAYPVQSQGTTLADWEKAMQGIKANGMTSCGVAIEWMRRQKQYVEQIVMITDEGENTAPRFKKAYQDYAKDLNAEPDVVFIKIGNTSNILEKHCEELEITPNAFEFRGDYYSLTNVIPLLTRPSLTDLVMEILSYPLPKRKDK